MENWNLQENWFELDLYLVIGLKKNDLAPGRATFNLMEDAEMEEEWKSRKIKYFSAILGPFNSVNVRRESWSWNYSVRLFYVDDRETFAALPASAAISENVKNFFSFSTFFSNFSHRLKSWNKSEIKGIEWLIFEIEWLICVKMLATSHCFEDPGNLNLQVLGCVCLVSEFGQVGC